MACKNCFNIYCAGIYKVRDKYNSGNKEKYYSNSQFNLPSYHMQQKFKTLNFIVQSNVLSIRILQIPISKTIIEDVVIMGSVK